MHLLYVTDFRVPHLQTATQQALPENKGWKPPLLTR